MSDKSILFVPDTFAHYRANVFNSIFSKISTNFPSIYLAFDNIDINYLPQSSSISSLFKYVSVKNFFFKNIVFWQKNLFYFIFSNRKSLKIIVFWGDSYRLSTWLSSIFARLYGIKVIFWTHGLYGNENPIKLFFRLIFYKLANTLFLYGKHSDFLLKSSFFSFNTLVVGNSLFDSSKLYSIRKSVRPLSLDIIRICFIGRLTSIKNIQLLFDAISLIPKSTPYIIDIVGDGPLFNKLSVSSNNNNINVKYHGAIFDTDEIINIVSNCNMIVSPGNVGLLAQHALSMGRPVITHSDSSYQMPEFDLLVNHYNSVFFDRGSAISLANSILLCFYLLRSDIITSSNCFSSALSSSVNKQASLVSNFINNYVQK